MTALACILTKIACQDDEFSPPSSPDLGPLPVGVSPSKSALVRFEGSTNIAEIAHVLKKSASTLSQTWRKTTLGHWVCGTI